MADMPETAVVSLNGESLRERDITIELLHLINRSSGTADLAKGALLLFHRISSCEAVSIRLKNGSDFPFYQVSGLPSTFVDAENLLRAREAAAGNAARADQEPCLECICGAVISGRTDQLGVFSTPGGTFWTNSTTEYLAGTSESDRPACMRGRCNSAGYESLALVPLHTGEHRLGLLHFSDRRKGMFSADSFEIWERLADQLAIALAKSLAEERIRHQSAVLEGINCILREALTCDTEEQLGTACLQVAEHITGSRFGFVGEVNPDSGRLDAIAISDPGWEACRIDRNTTDRHVPKGFEIHGLYGRVLHEGRGFFTNDPSSHPDSIGLPEGHPPIRSFLGVPMTRNGQVTGMIALANREGGYRDDDFAAVEALAEPISQALLRRRTAQALRESEERLKAATAELETRVQDRTALLQKTLDALQYERQRFNDVLDKLPAYIVLLTPDYHVLFANRFFRERFGESYGRRCYEYLFERSEPCEVCDTYKVLKTLAPHRWEWLGPDGRNYDISDFPFTDRDGTMLILEMGIDITDRKLAESELEKHRHHLEELVLQRTSELESLNTRLKAEITERRLREERIARLTKLYAVLSRVNELIVRTRSEAALYDEICRIIAEDGGFPLAWVGSIQGRQITPVASCGPQTDYLRHIRVEIDGKLGAGPTGTCAREGRAVINEDFLTSPSTEPWRQPALGSGFRASASFPLRSQGEVTGTLTLYATVPGAFDDEQITLLEALCADVSYALDAMHQEYLRSLAEEALRRSLGRFELLTETAGELLRAPEPQKTVDWLCHRVMEHLGCQAFFNFLTDEPSGRLRLNACAGIPDEDIAEIEWLDYGVAVCGCVAREGCRIIAEHIPATADPRTELVRSYGIKAYACHPLTGPGGKVLGTLSFGTMNRETFSEDDLSLMKAVTDQVAVAMMRVKDEQALRKSEELYRTIAQSIPGAAVLVFNPESRCIVAEGSLVPKLQLLHESAESHLLPELFAEPLAREIAKRFARVLAGEAFSLEEEYAGMVLWSQYVPLCDESETVVAAMVISLEITERKRAEEALAQAKLAAEQASRAKDHFLAVLSHELRTPLNPVLTAACMMLEEPALKREQRELAEMIRRNAELEARLIDDLLDLTRISRGKLVLQMAIVDVHESLRHVIAICEDDIRSKRLEVMLLTGAGHHQVRGDSARLQQVFWNLLKNAVKFSPPEGRITLRTMNMSPGSISIIVEDTGIGIETEVLPRIFDAFEQGGEGTTQHFGGLGLGLAICRGLVTLHGGTIIAHSAGKGTGACFTVTLRVFSGEETRTEVATAPLEVTSVIRRRVLLVEDHADTALLMQRLLQKSGHEIVLTGTMTDALNAVRADGFDLIISDIGLPDGSGIELMQQVRQQFPVKGIALSGYGMEEDIQRSLDAGFDAHLVKPIDIRKLQETIASLLQDR